VSDEALTPAVRALIVSSIDSVAQLEILLLLRREAARAWSPPEVAAELRMGAPGMQAQLESLRSRGLVAEAGGAYRYSPGEQADAVDGLAALYASFPVAVITAIYSKPPPDLKNFADAFRIRRPGGAGGEGGAGG
jgi:hypothetical protein